MPIVLAPLLPFAIRLGAIAAAGFAAKRFVAGRTVVGRTDQRAEDAMDNLAQGLAVHRPGDLPEDRQTNAAARVVRVIRIGGRTIEVDAAFMGRFRIRRTQAALPGHRQP
jgi:hypothetical protein